jgi:arginine exporter protein ArgO
MAEGTTYEIEVQAKDVGADATKAQVLGLADAIEAAERVLTPFDSALEAASSQLDAAAAAADVATQGLAEAEAEYKRLERAATSAAKKVERAQAKGKDTGALRAAANAAAVAVTKQATAVDKAATKANKAAAAQRKLAAAYKTVERRAARAAEETRGTERSFGDLFGAAGALGGPLGGLAGQISGVGDGLRAGGKGGGLITLGFAAANAIIMLQKAAIALTLALGGLVIGLLGYAIAADKATSKKLTDAWEKAKKNAKGLFEGVKTDRLVKPVQSLLRLLDKNTSAGKGLAHIFETILNPLIGGLEEAEPLAKEFFKGMIIGALKLIITFKRIRNAVVGAIPKETRQKIKDFVAELLSLSNAAKAGEGTFKVLTFAVLVLAGAFAFLAAVMLLPILLIAAFTVGPFLLAYFVIKRLSKAFKNLGKDAKSGGKEAGTSFSQGLVAGIMAGIGPAAKAARALIKAALGGAKDEAESTSPSKKMIRFGQYDMAGAVAIGFDRGQKEVVRAAREMSAAAIEGTTEQRPAQEARAQQRGTAHRDGDDRRRTIHVHEGAIVIHGAKDEREMAARVKEVLQVLLDGEALQMGAGETVAA